ncbi:MAG: MFS transporter [Bacteroidales bacterium]|nr:MFS transporter [Bacteroidales bacterium]
MTKNNKNISNNTNSEKFQFSNIITISLAHLLHDIFTSFLAPVLPLLISRFGISLTLSSFLNVVQRIPSLISPFIGLLADKVTLRYLVIVSPAITAISMSLLGVAPSYIFLVVLLLVTGLSSIFFHVPSPVMIKKVSGNKPGMGMSFYMLGGELARTLGPLTILGAISLWGFEGTYKLIPFALLASFIIFLKLRKISIYKEFVKQNKKETSFKTFTKFLPFFSYLAIFLFFTSMLKSGIAFFLPKYLTDQGETLWFGGIALSIFQFSGAIGTFLSGTISDYIGRKKILMITSVFTPVLMLLFIKTSGTIFTFPILILLGIFCFANTPVILSMVNNLDTDRPAFFNGIFFTIGFFIGAVAIMIVGAFGDWIGLENTFLLSSVFAIGALFVIHKL